MKQYKVLIILKNIEQNRLEMVKNFRADCPTGML
jgi:hypothetical protein